MIDQYSRISGLVKGKLKQVAMNKNSMVGHLVSYGLVNCPPPGNPDAPAEIQTGWTVMVTMRNPVVGEGDIGVSIPIPGVLPPDTIFEQATEYLFGQCFERFQAKSGQLEMVGKDLSGLKLGA